MVTSRKSLSNAFSKYGISALLLAIVTLLVVTLAAPVAKADNANDMAKGLANQHYYITQAVQDNSGIKQKNPNLDQQIKDTVNKLKGKHDTRIGILSNSDIPQTYSSLENYGNFLYGYLSNPKPEVLVMVNAQNGNVSLFSNKLSASERQTIINDSLSSFTTQGLAAGTTMIAQKAADKISSNETSGTLITVAIVVIIVLVIAGAIAYMIISTRNNWKRKVAGVEQLANAVSDQVVKVSDDINFLPDASRQQADAEFGAATQNFSDANASLRELQKVSPVTLLLKGADYQRKLDLTGAQFEQARQSLSRVEQQVRSLPGY
ncbi:MAG TPA: hypothetical protein VH186_30275 [Chloroflexia bacterium]|nr:hypothetical protein [Chloroflexia bacterium]